MMSKSDKFTVFDDALKTANTALDVGSINRTDYTTLQRCYGAMSNDEKSIFDLAMKSPIIEDGSGIFNSNGTRIG